MKVKTFLAATKVLLILSIGAALAGFGCATYAPAAQGRAFAIEVPAPASSEAWPLRSIERIEDIIAISPEIFSLRVRYDTLLSGRIVKEPKHIPARELQHSYTAGRGIIRTFLPPSPSERIMSMGMCFFSGVESNTAPKGKKRNLTVRGENDENEPWLVNLRGTWMRLDTPTGGQSRGLILHLTSFGGYQYERPVLEELRKRGWAVLWVDSSTVRPDATQIEVDNDDTAPAGAQIAAMIDDRVAEIAYAVEGALDFIHQHRHDIPTSRLVITGYSAGSLATPAVATLLGDRVEAAVLVGSGCNLLDIAQRSTLTDGGLKLRWARTPTPEDRQRLLNDYLEASRLDPYWTSASLRHKPVLMLHANLDRIVPADTGDLLYDRLGRPERLNFYLGHELLFFRLPSQTHVIANWVDSAQAQVQAAYAARARHHRTTVGR